MKRLTSLLSLLFIALSLHVNAATIKEIIQANSNVQILAFENDPTNPYTIVGTDSLQSGGSGVKTLRIKYQADAVVQLTYKEMVSCIISVDGVESFNYNMYLPAGTHELTLEISSSRRHYIVGLGLTKVCSNLDIKKWIQNQSNVRILSFTNDTFDPYVLKTTNEETSLYNERDYRVQYDENFEPLPGQERIFDIQYISDSITAIQFNGNVGRSQSYTVVVNERDTLLLQSKSNLMLNPGKYTLRFISSRDYDNNLESISILSVGTTTQIKELIDEKSDVSVDVINDAFHPWVRKGDSIVFDGSCCIAKKELTLTVNYHSDKMTKVAFKLHWWNNDSILVDGDKWYSNYVMNGTDTAFIVLMPGSHTLAFKHVFPENTVNEESGNLMSYTKQMGIYAFSIQTMGAMTPIDMNFQYPQEKETYYDMDGDGKMEFLSNSTIQTINWSKRSLDNWIKYTQSPYPQKWLNLTNDTFLDSYTRYGSNDSYGILLSDKQHQFTELATNEVNWLRTLIPMDYNNDGYPDLVGYQSDNGRDLENDKAYTIWSDGEMQQSAVKVLTYGEYTNQTIRKYRGSLASTSFPSLKNGWMISNPPRVPYKAMLPMNIDLNGDGIEDYFDNGNLYINTGDGNIVYQEFPEGTDWVELNNDGVMDAVAFESPNVVIYMLKQDGSYTSKKIYSGAQYTTLWCYDFDKDNDKDILLAFNYSTTLGGSYLILLESIDNDQYKDHEYFFDSKLEFAHCVDYDNDGMFEIIGRDATNGTTDLATLFSLKVQGTTINETITPLGVYAKQTNSDGFRNYQVADVNNDGIMELSCYSKNGYTYMQLADSANERPSQPNSPTLLYEASTGILSITWEQGKDKETSSVDLTYALRIGTESGKGDIVYAHALPDGTRRNRMGGNQSSNRYRLLNTQTWAPGKYYIAVQCVDPNNRGSLFSKEVIFEKTVPACAFDLQYNSPFGVGDTCTIHLHRNVLLTNQYDLQISNANIIDTLSNGRSIRIVFHQAGEQTITLTQKNQQGLTLVKEEKYIVVHPIPVINETQALGNMMVAMDIDEDGKMEYYVDEYGFYAYDTQNNYAKINKMWNNHTYITAPAYADFHKDYVADINKDGKSDMFANYSSQWYRLINNGNKSMTIDDQLLTVPFSNTQLNKMIDFNNDGYLDIAYYKNQYGITYNYILKNEGDYYTFTQSTQDKGKACLFKDINKDGLVDYLQEVTLDGNGTNGMIAYQNNGDFTFSVSDTLVRYDKGTVIYYMEDFDNDGILDWIYKSNGEFYIRWSNGEDTLLEGITGVTNLNLRYMNLYDDETNVIDLNNDGYLDIYATGGLNDHAGVLLFKSNHQYEFIEGIELHRSNGYTYLPFLMPDGYIRMGEKNVASNNTRPSAPTNITSSQTAKGVTITWLHSQDKETPAVRMKYNISIKKKGATGEGAYLISPYNSTKNGVHIPTTLHLIEGNQFFIPLASIPIGEYEVQVQGVDLHFLESDFSAVYNLTVSEIVGIEAPAATGVGIETQVTFAGNITPTIDWNGGQVITSNDNTYTITWDSEGIKHITAGEYSHSIYVHALPDATFTLPNEVMQFATVSIPAKNARDGKWNIAINGSDKYSLLSSYENVETLSLDMNTIVIRFLQEGTYNLRHCIDTDYGTSEYVQAVTVTTNPIAPTIRMVTQNNGVYQVLWQGGEVLPADVTAIRVYKESSYADIYTLLAELPLDSTSFTDWMSMPHVQSSRYALTYVTTYGESTKSTAHTGLHVMINKGMANTWNLSWAKYEGRKVAQYRIWRGNTAENLNLIGQVSGNMTSYSDIMTTDDVNYYAVEVIFEDEPSYRLAKRKNAIQPTSTLSNVVSTLSTNEVTFVEQILLQGEDIIAGKNLSSQLQAYVYPYYATYKLVNWVIMEGQEFASINNNGLLTLKNHYTNGTVLVRAYALDGSEVYSDIQIKVSGFKDTFKLIYKVDDEVWATKTYKVGESIILEAEPTKEGYTFTGWSEVPATMPAHDVEVNGFFTPSTSTSLDNVTDEDNNKAQKVIKDGVLYIILPDGTKYSAMGQKI